MKKLVLFLAVAFSVSLFSCGGSDKKAEADTVATDTVAVVEETVVETVDSTACCDSCAAACDSCKEAAAKAE